MPSTSLSPAYFFLERFPWLMVLVDLGRAKAMRFASRRHSRLLRYRAVCQLIVPGLDGSGLPAPGTAIPGMSQAGGNGCGGPLAGHACRQSRFPRQ